jgi:hypothetical protein
VPVYPIFENRFLAWAGFHVIVLDTKVVSEGLPPTPAFGRRGSASLAASSTNSKGLAKMISHENETWMDLDA